MKSALYLLTGHPADDKTALLGSGDKARAKGDWAEAASHYSAYLSVEPEDFAIWVQLGHAYKEAGAFSQAQDAYNEAIKLKPDDFDSFLNLGHLMKLSGDRAAAVAAYIKSYELNPSSRDAFRELAALGVDPSTLDTEKSLKASKTIFLDMTDLIEYAKTNPSLSGIQRVVANLIGGIEHYYNKHQEVHIIPVIPEYDNMRAFAVNRSLVLLMIKALQEAAVDRAALNKAIDAVYASRKPVEPKRGDIFVIAGAFWIYPHYDMILRFRDEGVKFVVFIHDLIQISHPEFVHEAATLTFRRALVDVLMLANGVLTNSEFVAQDVRNFMQTRMKFELPVQAVPLATELPPSGGRNRTLSDKVRDVIRDPYVLSVSTIEVRKNHMYMVRLWEKLIESHIPNIPNLVFVGKIGWDVEKFRQYLTESDHLGGRLRVLHGVTDFELSELYEHAMFTMFPSFVEGFGLPVGESLAHRKPCISSNRSSMPEVGGKFARYVNPEDVGEGYALVRDLLANPDKLDHWTSEIATSFKPKTWDRFSMEFFDAAAKISKPDEHAANRLIEAATLSGWARPKSPARRPG